MNIEHTAIIVDDYDSAISFYVHALGFELVEDSPSLTNDGSAKRWVVVRPPGAATGLLLARADGERERTAIGAQFAGRVGLFLRVDDFDAAYHRMLDHGVEFLSEPRNEPYGRVAVFVDVAGNKWDLLGQRCRRVVMLALRLTEPGWACRPVERDSAGERHAPDQACYLGRAAVRRSLLEPGEVVHPRRSHRGGRCRLVRFILRLRTTTA